MQIVGALATLALIVIAAASLMWRNKFVAMSEALDAQPAVAQALTTNALPAPVARFFSQSISPDFQPTKSITLDTAGDFLMTPGPHGWRPFRAHQRFNAFSPGFVWDARIAMTPAITVMVRDSYVRGRGEMIARVLGLYTVAKEGHSPALAQGELIRYLAEMMWFPDALRPGRGVSWTPIDDRHADAHLTDGSVTVSIQFTFNDSGDIVEVFAPTRMRAVDGRFEPTPWAVRCWDHQVRGGLRIPMQCEAEWRFPDGPQAYWRGRVTTISRE